MLTPDSGPLMEAEERINESIMKRHSKHAAVPHAGFIHPPIAPSAIAGGKAGEGVPPHDEPKPAVLKVSRNALKAHGWKEVKSHSPSQGKEVKNHSPSLGLHAGTPMELKPHIHIHPEPETPAGGNGGEGSEGVDDGEPQAQAPPEPESAAGGEGGAPGMREEGEIPLHEGGWKEKEIHREATAHHTHAAVPSHAGPTPDCTKMAAAGELCE